MRSSRLCSVRNAARFIASSSSTSYFNGYIPFEKFTKSVTFDGDCGIPQAEYSNAVVESEYGNGETITESEEDKGTAEEKKNDNDKEILKLERIERENALSEEERTERRDQSNEIKNQGNQRFGEGSWEEAAALYTKALDHCPFVYSSERSIYLSNRAACYMKLAKWDVAIEDCTEAIELGAKNDKPLERRAYCYAQTEQGYENAIKDYEQLMKNSSKKAVYAQKILDLQHAINERNERVKEDVLAKLKDLGNMCLRPFGLTTDNFKLEEKPDGGYSLSMKK
ncbi:unnamed protein product [Anisakis simplex]|uniref:Tetratricopeptide repeat protein 1 (inferred by orthology to a human protein) n=1 Tax=Anisakis simplex TaxID=6269 RepID=A0A0M3JVL2_ANISI|nr:unnamed protein product [Anisakis simplex]